MPCLLCTCMVLTGLSDGPLYARAAFNKALILRGGKGTPLPTKGVRTLVIDAGHGGKDPGGSGPNCHEKDIVLNVARLLSIGVRANFADVEVIMTRADDTFIPLHERAAIANAAGADLFISIHANVIVGSAGTAGTETYVMGQHVAEENLRVAKRENASILLEDDVENNYGYDPNSPEGHIMMANFQHAHLERSIEFADLLEKQYAARGRKSRGVKQAGFVVLKRAGMPAVLTELGFMTNSAEEKYLMSTAGQAELADALLAAFGAYHQRLGGSLPNRLVGTPKNARQWTAKGISPTAIRYVAPVAAKTPARVESAPGVAPATPVERVRPVPVGGSNAPLIYSPPNVVVPGRQAPRELSYVNPVPIHADTSRTPLRWRNADTKENRRKKTDYRNIPESELTYVIQLLVSSKNYTANDARWNPLPYPLVIEPVGELKAYRCVFSTAAQARTARPRIRQAGYETHLFVLHRGKRLPNEVVEYLMTNR